MAKDVVGFIPAGGRGERLRPLTNCLPKPLLQMGSADKRIVDFPLDSLAGVASRVLLVTGYCGHKFDLGFSHEKVMVLNDKQLLNIGGSLLQHLPRLRGEGLLGDETIMIPGDHVIQGVDIQCMLEEHLQTRAEVTIGLIKGKKYGDLVSLGPNNQITGIKPDHNRLSSTGIYVFNSSFLIKQLSTIANCGWDCNPCDLTREIVFPAVSRGLVFGYEFEDGSYWDDAGTVDRYFWNNMRLSGGLNVVSTSASVATNTQLSHTIVLDNACVEEGVSLDRAIVLPLSRITKASTGDCLRVNFNRG